MTEAEWLASHDINQLLGCVIEKEYPEAEPCNWGRGERKKLLFIAACGSRILNRLPAELNQLFEQLGRDGDWSDVKETTRDWFERTEEAGGNLSNLLFAISYDDIGLFCYDVARIKPAANQIAIEEAVSAEEHHHASFLRDIFKNPFRPVIVGADWLTSTVVALAEGIYEDRAFDRLPVLASALEDAGCDSTDILNHLRSDGPHVKGCWALDLVLGKE